LERDWRKGEEYCPASKCQQQPHDFTAIVGMKGSPKFLRELTVNLQESSGDLKGIAALCAGWLYQYSRGVERKVEDFDEKNGRQIMIRELTVILESMGEESNKTAMETSLLLLKRN
jgi:hypothetical protein